MVEHLRDECPTAHDHLKYVRDYWTTETLWQSWSDLGRQIAARVLNCPFENVLPTTNHLESFNGILKRKHLYLWQKESRRLRVDILVHLLIVKVFLSIFEQRAMEAKDDLRWKNQIQKLAG
jgi:hypothetical protein